MSDRPAHLHENRANDTDHESSAPSELASHVNGHMLGEAKDTAALEDLGSSEEEDVEDSTNGEAFEEGIESGGSEDALVSIVTADFAMQNLILQLGLRLISPDGRRIRRISRWALRCSACFKVTKVNSLAFE